MKHHGYSLCSTCGSIVHNEDIDWLAPWQWTRSVTTGVVMHIHPSNLAASYTEAEQLPALPKELVL